MTWEISLGDILTMTGGIAAMVVFIGKRGKTEGVESAELKNVTDGLKDVVEQVNEISSRYSTLDNKIESKYAELNAQIYAKIAQVQSQFQVEIEKQRDKLSSHVLESTTKYTLLDAKLQNIDKTLSEDVKPTLQKIQGELQMISNKLYQG